MKLRYRIPADWERWPMFGEHVMSRRGRGAYLILSVDDKGLRGGLGQPVERLFVLSVDRVPRADGVAACSEDRCWEIIWDKRERRRRSVAEFQPTS